MNTPYLCTFDSVVNDMGTNNAPGQLMADSNYTCFGVDPVCRFVRVLDEAPIDRLPLLQAVIRDIHCRYDQTLRRLSG